MKSMDKPTLQNARNKLKEVWGYPAFRSGQEEVISSVLEGNETLVLSLQVAGNRFVTRCPRFFLKE